MPFIALWMVLSYTYIAAAMLVAIHLEDWLMARSLRTRLPKMQVVQVHRRCR